MYLFGMHTSPQLEPPGPRGLPLVGDSLDYMRDPLGYMLRMRRLHGGLVRLPLRVLTPYLVSEPSLIEQVLVTDNKSYTKDMFLRLLGKEVLGQGLLTSEGDFWRRQRRLSQPAFHRERITEYATIMLACADEYVATLRAGQSRDVHDDMMRLTLQIAARALFGTDAGDMATEVGRALSVVMDRYANNVFLMFPQMARLPLPMNRRLADARSRLDRLMFSIIQKRRAEGDKGQKTDLLAMLLSAQDEDGSVMTDQQLRDEVMTIFSAGHETTALVMSYAFLLLSQNPAAGRALSAELQTVLGGRAPTPADLPSLRYCEAVVLESMRIYPPAWALGREASRDTELGGYPVPRGMQVWISPWVMHRDAQYFPKPEAFAPERWLDGLAKRLPRFAYMPFGGGPRLCIGNAFAMTEATLILAAIASRFRLRVVDTRPPPLMPSITLRPKHGLTAQVEPC